MSDIDKVFVARVNLQRAKFIALERARLTKPFGEALTDGGTNADGLSEGFERGGIGSQDGNAGGDSETIEP